MNKLWHFGDSFTTCGNFENIFSEYIAFHFNLELNHNGHGGTGNFEIFSEIIKKDTSFKSGDIILINWSYFNRITLIEQNGDLIGIDNLLINFKDKIEKNKINLTAKNFLLDYANDWSFLESVRLFKHIIHPYLKGLEKRGVKIKMVFLEQMFPYNINKTIFYNKFPMNDSIITDLFKKNWILEFHHNYCNFLVSRDWMKDESVHYAKNIQPLLADEYIKRIIETDNKK